MHPDISRFPSKAFYQGALADGPGMDIKTKQPWHSDAALGPFRFFDVKGTESKRGLHSLANMKEVEVAIAIYEKLKKVSPKEDFSFRIGVISMYKAQVEALRAAFRGKYGPHLASKIDFNTVDGFQGQEKDIIFLSCVRAGDNATVGFLSDTRRLNVAITRARSSLFVIGNSKLLARHHVWNKMIEMSKASGCFEAETTVNSLSRPSVPKAPMAKLPSSPPKPNVSPAKAASVKASPKGSASSPSNPKQNGTTQHGKNGASASSPGGVKRSAAEMQASSSGGKPSGPAPPRPGPPPQKPQIGARPPQSAKGPSKNGQQAQRNGPSSGAGGDPDLIPLGKKPRINGPGPATSGGARPSGGANGNAQPGNRPSGPSGVKVDQRARKALFVPKRRP